MTGASKQAKSNTLKQVTMSGCVIILRRWFGLIQARQVPHTEGRGLERRLLARKPLKTTWLPEFFDGEIGPYWQPSNTAILL